MIRVYLVTECPDLAESLARHLRLAHRVEPATIHVPAPPVYRVNWVVDSFRRVADALELAEADHDSARGGAIVLVALGDGGVEAFDSLSPFATTGLWPALAGMLVLCFPEVHWLFLDPAGLPIPADLRSRMNRLPLGYIPRPGPPPFATAINDALEAHAAGLLVLFDPSGLRDAVRRRLNAGRGGDQRAFSLPRRRRCAAAIDEETVYANFLAYTAYRFGYRCHVVGTYRMMDRVFGKDGSGTDVDLTLEDIYLNFSDRPPSLPLSNLAYRDRTLFPLVADAPLRVFVTSGHQQGADRKIEAENRSHLEALRLSWEPIPRRGRARPPRAADAGRAVRRRTGTRSATLIKPVSGIFDLWSKSGLRGWLSKSGLRGWLCPRGRAPGFRWPPRSRGPWRAGGAHSTPGRLLEVVERLVRRAQRGPGEGPSVPAMIYGALLALEAHEITANRTPTIALEALTLKHQYEVRAECLFLGVKYNLDVTKRLKEIREEVCTIGTWFEPWTRRDSKAEARGNIVNRLVAEYAANNQFEEEQAARHEARLIRFRKNPLMRCYVLPLLGTPLLLFLAVPAWIVAFGLLYWHLDGQGPFLFRWVAFSALNFVGLGIPGLGDVFAPSAPKLTDGILAAVVSEVFLAFFHLGVLITSLYSIISRK